MFRKSMIVCLGVVFVVCGLGVGSVVAKEAAKNPAKKAQKKAKKAIKKAVKEVKSACKVHLEVHGMTCHVGCAPAVTMYLKGIKEIQKVVVSFKHKTATVHGSGSICQKKLAQAIIDKAFRKKYYACKIKKIVALSQKPKAAKAKKPAKKS